MAIRRPSSPGPLRPGPRRPPALALALAGALALTLLALAALRGAAAAATKTFADPTYGWSITYDPAVWAVDDQQESGPVNYLSLHHAPIHVTINASNIYADNAADCRDDVARRTRRNPPVSNFQPLRDATGQPVVGQAGWHAYGSYTLTFNGGNRRMDIDCRVLKPGKSVLWLCIEWPAGDDTPRQAAAQLLKGLKVPTFKRPAPPAGAGEISSDGTTVTGRDNFADPSIGLISTGSVDPTPWQFAYVDGEFVTRALTCKSGGADSFVPRTDSDITVAIDVHLIGETANREVCLACRLDPQTDAG